MDGLLIQETNKSFTKLKNIFSAIDNEQNKYNWLITEIDYATFNKEIATFSQPYTWISGEELTARIEEDDGFWVWGVFSGFTKDVELKDILKYPLPYADGYEGFWNPEITIQHPLASVELVEWDSTAFIAITENQIILNSCWEK